MPLLPVRCRGAFAVIARHRQSGLNAAHRELDSRVSAAHWERLSAVLSGPWMLSNPSSRLQRVSLQPSCDDASQRSEDSTSTTAPGFWVLRDDELHPLVGGNKIRKLDGLFPRLMLEGVTDVVTCGGLQSAHTAAVAAMCAERGIAAHLLVRGEAPKVPCGHHLIALMFGNVRYVSRKDYSNRSAMLDSYVAQMEADQPDPKVAVVAEGAGDASALLGLIRLVAHLASKPEGFAVNFDHHSLLSVEGSGRENAGRLNIVVDSGTGTTAVGLALGIWLLDLPWRVRSGNSVGSAPA